MKAKHILAQRSVAFNPDWANLALLNNFILNNALSSNILFVTFLNNLEKSFRPILVRQSRDMVK